jgi:hypothetical protein
MDRDSERGGAQCFAEISPGRRPADGRDEREVGRVEHGGHERAAHPARRARDAHGHLPSCVHAYASNPPLVGR